MSGNRGAPAAWKSGLQHDSGRRLTATARIPVSAFREIKNMTHVDVPINVFAHFEIDRLAIVAELVSAQHQFVFNGKNVTVSLPGLDRAGLPVELQRIRLYKWKSDGNVPLEYAARSLAVEMELPDPIHVPQEILHLPAKQFELFEPSERDRLDRIVKEAGEDLRAAFSEWLKVLRWKSGIGYIGEPSISYGGDHQSAALCERATGHRLWTQTGVIVLQAGRPLTEADWSATQSALLDLKQVPLWFDFLFDSEMRLNNKDLVGAVLSLSIALEANIRFIFFGELSKANLDPVVVDVFDLTNIRPLLDRLKKTKHWNSEWASAADMSTFHRLMDLRNKVMHLAKIDALDSGELRRMYQAVKKFAYFTSDALGLS
jgi:hypothetical protein